MLADWKDTLFSYNFECIYRPGLLNIIPDALSRAFPDELYKMDDSTKGKTSNKVAAISSRKFRHLADNSKSSKEQGPIEMMSVTSKELAEHFIQSIGSSNIEVEDITMPEPITLTDVNSDNKSIDTTISKDKENSQLEETSAPDHSESYRHNEQSSDTLEVVDDEELRKELMKEVHDFGHLGANAMVTALRNRGYTWPKLKETCLRLIRQCSACQHYNIARKGYHPLKAIHATLPGEHLAIDLAQFPVSDNGNNYALLVVDVCTRFVFLEPLAQKDANTIASILFKLFCTIGFPKIIQSDNGTEFVNEVIKELMKKSNVDHRLTTPYHPRANGVVERMVRSTKSTLSKLIEGRIAKWDYFLPMAQLQLNAKVTSLHNSTPFSLFFARPFAGFGDFSNAQSHLLSEEDLQKRLDYMSNLVYPAISKKSSASQKKMVDKFNASHFIVDFPEGSYVMVKDQESNSVFDAKYEGPFKVVRRTSRGAYILKDATDELLKRHYSPEQLKPVDKESDNLDSDQSYEVESIVSHRLNSAGEWVYTVKWKGYDESFNDEIPYDNFDSKAIIHNYHKKLNELNPHKIAKKTKRNLKEMKTETQRVNKRQRRN